MIRIDKIKRATKNFIVTMANNAATTGKENYYYYFYYYYWHCVKSQKVMSSIPDSVTGIFH